MKKRLPALLLALLMLAAPLTGCSDSLPVPSEPDPKPDSEPPKQEEVPVEDEKALQEAAEALAAENGLSMLGEALELNEEVLDVMEVTDVQLYEDEAVVRYTQTYEGVEIYGSSVVVADGEESYSAGTIFDFSEIFDETFPDLAREAATVPEWMQDNEAVRFHPDTLKPLIYTTADGQAGLTRSFEATLFSQGKSVRVQMITSLDGSVMLEVIPLDQPDGFTETQVVSSIPGACSVSEQNGKYYAFNLEYNVYVADRILQPDEEVKDYANRYLQKGGMTFRSRHSTDLMYNSSNDDWTTGTRADALQVLTTYCDVAEWYRSRFGYFSLDGNNGLAVLALEDGTGSPASNYSSAMIVVQPAVADIPEILVHEFCHSVYMYTTGTKDSRNEAKALNEAISDTFAALYLCEQGDTSWHLAANTPYSKNIPASSVTMDDYAYNRYADAPKIDWELFDKRYWIDLGFYIIGEVTDGKVDVEIEGVDGESSTKAHENSFIISKILYNIWKDEFQRDSYSFGQVLFRTLRYLPSQPTFPQFRDAFLHAMGKIHDADTVTTANNKFDKAGVKSGGIANTQHMLALDILDNLPDNLNQITLYNISKKNYEYIRNMPWDNIYITDGNMAGTAWNAMCEWKESSYSFNFLANWGEDPEATPYLIYLTDFRQGGMNLPVTDKIKTGMTYAQIAAVADVSPLEVLQVGYGAILIPEEGCTITLFFDSANSYAVLYGAEIYYS